MLRNKLIKSIITCTCALICIGGMTTAAAQGMPKGMIFFVAEESCPSGSSAAQDAAGRVIMVTTNTAEIGKTSGTPMKDQKDNMHTHTGSMTVNLPSHHVAGASSCCNGQATSQGDHTASITTGAATTNLPFIQLLVCEVN